MPSRSSTTAAKRAGDKQMRRAARGSLKRHAGVAYFLQRLARPTGLRVNSTAVASARKLALARHRHGEQARISGDRIINSSAGMTRIGLAPLLRPPRAPRNERCAQSANTRCRRAGCDQHQTSVSLFLIWPFRGPPRLGFPRDRATRAPVVTQMAEDSRRARWQRHGSGVIDNENFRHRAARSQRHFSHHVMQLAVLWIFDIGTLRAHRREYQFPPAPYAVSVIKVANPVRPAWRKAKAHPAV